TRRGAETRSFACFKAHFCCRRLSHLIPALLMPARAAPATERSVTRFPGTSAVAPRRRPSGSDVAAMADDLRADLDLLLAQAGHRPRLRCLGHRQRSHEVAKVIRKRVELETHGVGGQGAA